MDPETLRMIQWGAVISASLAAAVIDVKYRRIPNLLCGPLFLAGLLWSLSNNGVKGLTEAVASAVLLSLPFVLLFIFAGGGAGDAKLTGAIGAWLSINESAVTLACICIVGGILGIVVAIYRGKLKLVLINLFFIVFDFVSAILSVGGIRSPAKDAGKDRGEKLAIPYGVAIFIGVCVAGIIVWLRQI
jgi:prepilin peptidase CpaA